MSKIAVNYFLSILKRQKKLLFLYTVICFAAFPMVALISNNYDYGSNIYEYSLIMYALFMAGCVLVLPIIINKFSLNKRSVDTYYALPISRKHLFDVHYLAGAVSIYAPLLLNYVIGMLILTVRYGIHAFTGIYFLAFLGLVVITMAIYSINTLIVTKVNNMIDAAILIAAYTILPYMLLICAMSFIEQFTVGFSERIFNLSQYFAYLCPLTVLSEFVGAVNDYVRNSIWDYSLLWLLYEAAIAIGFYIWGVSVFKKRKGEDSEQVSRDFFTYPLVVNLASLLMLSMYILDFSEIVLTITIIVITFIIYLIMHFISRRSMKVTMPLIIKYFVILAAFNLFAFAARTTYFFGINLQTPNINQYTQLEVSYWDYDVMDGIERDYRAVVSLQDLNKDEEKFLNDLFALQKVAAENKKENPGYLVYYNEDTVYLRVAFKTDNEDVYDYYNFNLPRKSCTDLLESKLFKEVSFDVETASVY